MFDSLGTRHIVQELSGFMREHGGKLPAPLARMLDKAVNEGIAGSPVVALVDSMERLYSAFTEMKADGKTPVTAIPAASRDAAARVLGLTATAVAQGSFHGKGDRASLIAAWAAQQIVAVQGVTPLQPDVDPAYSFADGPEIVQ